MELTTMNNYFVSVVVPVFNEAENIPLLVEQLKKVLARYKEYEILIVDDGSTDNTLSYLKSIAKQSPFIRYISLSNNFGQQYALKAGLDHTQADCVVTMDGDLQHPPDCIPEMVDQWQQGYQIVNMVRRKKGSKFSLKRMLSQLFYQILNQMSDLPLKEGVSDFRLYDKQVVLVLKQLEERNLFLRGLVPWLGFRQSSLYYQPNPRYKGTPKYTWYKMFKLAIDGLTSTSLRPLYLSIYLGTVIAGLALLYGIYAIIVHLYFGITLTGWTSLIVSVNFLAALQLIFLGVIGMYLSKILTEVKKRPFYVVKESSDNLKA